VARESIGTLHLQFKANTRGFIGPMRDVTRAVRAVDRQVARSSAGWKSLAKSVLTAVVAYKALRLAFRGVVGSIEVAAEFERQEAALGALIGNAKIAKELTDDLIAFSLATPFTFKELLAGSKQLLAFGFAAKQILPVLAVLGEAAAATGTALADAVFPFAQARTESKQVWKDIRQFTSKGILSLEDLAAEIGIATDEIRAFSAAGKLNFTQIASAMKKNAIEGGRFSGLMGTIAQTTFGLIQRFKDLWQLIQKGTGEAIIEVFNLRQNMQDLFATVGSLVTSGKFKDAMVAWISLLRDAFVWFVGRIEQTVRIMAHLLGTAFSVLVGLAEKFGDVLGLSSKKQFILRQTFGESRDAFIDRAALKKFELDQSGEKVLESKIRFVDPLAESLHPGGSLLDVLFTVDARSEIGKVIDRMKEFGKELQNMPTTPDWARSLELMLNPDGQSVVFKNITQMYRHFIDSSTKFWDDLNRITGSGVIGTSIELLRELLASARTVLTTGIPLIDSAVRQTIEPYREILKMAQELAAQSTFAKVLNAPVKFIQNLAAKFETGFDKTALLFDEVSKVLEKAVTQIRNVVGPRVTFRQQVDELIGQSKLDRTPGFVSQAQAARKSADMLDRQLLRVQEMKMLWQLSQKVIADTVDPMQQLHRFSLDTLIAQQKGFLNDKQRLAGIRAMAKELFKIADAKIDPFEAFAKRKEELETLLADQRISLGQFTATLKRDREAILNLGTGSELRPSSGFRFARAAFSGKIAGGDTASLLRQQNKQQNVQIVQAQQTNRTLSRMEQHFLQAFTIYQRTFPGGF
jgi:hypothetical protein